MFQDGFESSPLANTRARRSKTRFYFVEECSECCDLNTATIQGSYERCVGLNVLCLVSYLNKNARQEFQIDRDCSNIFWCLFDGLAEVTKLLEAFSQLYSGGNYSYAARRGRKAFHSW